MASGAVDARAFAISTLRAKFESSLGYAGFVDYPTYGKFFYNDSRPALVESVGNAIKRCPRRFAQFSRGSICEFQISKFQSLGIDTLELQLSGIEPTWKIATALQWHRIGERARIRFTMTFDLYAKRGTALLDLRGDTHEESHRSA